MSSVKTQVGARDLATETRFEPTGTISATNVQKAIETAAAASSPAWGLITGTLSAQTDLQAALDAKLSTATAATTYQPLDADLTSWAAITRASGFDTFTATPSSANLASLVTGETGSGALVFGTTPTLATPVLSSYFDLTETTSPSSPGSNVARMWSEDNNGFSVIHWKDSAGVDHEMGRDLIHVVRNTSGGTLTKGQVVYISGVTSDVANVSLARADSASTMPAFGLVLADITNNSYGMVITEGDLTALDTSGFSAGAPVYVSASTAGLLTATEPTGTSIDQRVGIVIRAHPSLGVIGVTVGADINPALTQTMTNKTIALGSNTVSGTTAQFNTALSDGDFATLAGSETLTTKTINLTSNTLTGTKAQFDTACSDDNFAYVGTANTFTAAQTATSFIPSSATIPTNGLYLPAANTLGFAINSAADIQMTATALSPAVDGGNSLGTTALGWQNLFGNTGFVWNIEGGNWVATHTTGILTVGTGDLRVTTAGTNTASVVTVGGTQTLTAKTLTSPTLTTPVLGTPSSGTLTSCTDLPVATGISGLGTGVATFLAAPSSANLITAVTDETGSGALVFGTAPTISGAILTGTADVQQAMTWSGDISPTQITADQNNYAPTGFSTATVLRLNSDASRNITGLAGGADGRVILVHNVGSFAIVLKDENASSTAGNRFALNADVSLAADSSAMLQYDATSSRWRSIGGSGGAGGGDALTANPLSQFAATTSAQLAGVMSDETGSGALVFATSPTLVTPLLGTPTSGVLTNCTGLPTTVVANEASDTTCFVTFVTAASGELAQKTNTNLAFNSSTGVLNFGATPTVNGAGLATTGKAIAMALVFG